MSLLDDEFYGSMNDVHNRICFMKELENNSCPAFFDILIKQTRLVITLAPTICLIALVYIVNGLTLYLSCIKN